MKTDSQAASARPSPTVVLEQLISAIEMRGVEPSSGTECGKSVPSFRAKPPNETPFCTFVGSIHRVYGIRYVKDGREERGACVTRADLAELLAPVLDESPDTALWRLASLVCWSRMSKRIERDRFPFDQLFFGKTRKPTASEVAAALACTPVKTKHSDFSWEAMTWSAPRDDRWHSVALVGLLVFWADEAATKAYCDHVGVDVAETLLTAAIALDAKVPAETVEKAVRHNRMSDFAPAVVDALLGASGFTERVHRLVGRLFPASHPLGSWCAIFDSTPYHVSSLPAEEHALRRLRSRFRKEYEPERALAESSGSAAVAVVRLLEHFDSIEKHQYGFEHESHVARATCAAEQAQPLLPAFAPWIVQAFAEKAGEDLIEILSSTSNEPMLERLRRFEAGPERLGKVGAVADTILRRCGAIPTTAGNSEVRQLVGPLEPIRGQTWLNDVRLEHLLHEAARRGEEAFAQEYAKVWNEGEDDLLRDLFDGFLQPQLSAAIDETNRVARVPGRVWYLRWSKFSRQEEVHHGADLALEVKVAIHGRLRFGKTCFLQVKRMEAKGDRFLSGWRLDARQRSDLLRVFGPSAFYLLLAPSAVSSHQRVLPVDVAGGILSERRSKETLPDSVAACCSHSLAHFLVFDILAGWQGFPEATAFVDPSTHDPRQGRRARYLLRIELGFGG